MQMTHIKANRSWWRIDGRELWEYRDLLWFMVLRETTAVYRQSILGPAWIVLQPLATTLVFTVIFGNVARIQTDGSPHFLFYMSGMVFWNYFQGVLTGTANALINNAHVLGKVYFPRLVVPLALVISNLAQCLLNLATFAGFYVFFFVRGAPVTPSWWIALLPLLVVQCAVASLGPGLWLSALTVKYRDLRFALPFLAQLWMFATPIVYPASMVGERWRWILILNPMAGVIEVSRFAFFGTGQIQADVVVGGLAVSLLLLASGLCVFNKIQRTFVDTI